MMPQSKKDFPVLPCEYLPDFGYFPQIYSKAYPEIQAAHEMGKKYCFKPSGCLDVSWREGYAAILCQRDIQDRGEVQIKIKNSDIPFCGIKPYRRRKPENLEGKIQIQRQHIFRRQVSV